ncbi:hypothetical protein T08_7387, partial [Trichinella sp. T8]
LKYSNPLQLNAYTRIPHTFPSKFQKNILQRFSEDIKVWITRNKTLKSDCYILGRNIQLIASPIAVNGHAGATSLWYNKIENNDKNYFQKY